ncbi:MAG: glycosyltransferase family 2 protein [Eubacterium sp.]|nr:glycosyltransferase family 2 protein [Eubacterium sp.]
MLVSIVIPCYNSEKSIAKVVELTMEQFEQMEGYTCEFVLVNDNSRDNTYGQIKKLAKKYSNVKGISLMRNFGQHNALMCGLNYTNGDYIMGMDDDMQTHPSQIPKIIAKLEEGYDLAYGIYKTHKNSKAKNLSSWINKVTSRILLGRPKNIASSNFWIITRAVRDEAVKYKGFNPYVDGIFYRITDRIGNVEIEHHKREYGTSNYTFKKLLKLWMAYLNYSVIPLRIATVLGGIASAAGIILAIVVVIRKLIHPDILMGWASLMSAMVFFFGLVLLVIGIIGEYVGKAVMALSDTPQYIIRDTVNVPEKKDNK